MFRNTGQIVIQLKSSKRNGSENSSKKAISFIVVCNKNDSNLRKNSLETRRFTVKLSKQHFCRTTFDTLPENFIVQKCVDGSESVWMAFTPLFKEIVHARIETTRNFLLITISHTFKSIATKWREFRAKENVDFWIFL